MSEFRDVVVDRNNWDRRVLKQLSSYFVYVIPYIELRACERSGRGAG